VELGLEKNGQTDVHNNSNLFTFFHSTYLSESCEVCKPKVLLTLTQVDGKGSHLEVLLKQVCIDYLNPSLGNFL